MPEQKRPLKVFLCHAHIDKDAAKQLYDRLVKDGVDAWLDKEKLLGGANWEYEIRKAVRECDIFVVCVSAQFTQRFRQKNFSQTEVGIALNEAALKPKEQVYIIPVRLEDCAVPKSLNPWHWVDLFEPDGYQRLIRSLNKRIEELKEFDAGQGKTGQPNISVVISGQVGGNVIIGNDNDMKYQPENPVERSSLDITDFGDEIVVPLSMSSEDSLSYLNKFFLQDSFSAIFPDGFEHAVRGHPARAEKKIELFGLVEGVLIVDGKEHKQKIRGNELGVFSIAKISASRSKLLITRSYDGGELKLLILKLIKQLRDDSLVDGIIRGISRDTATIKADIGVEPAPEISQPKLVSKHKIKPEIIVAIIGLIGTLLAALIGILPQIINLVSVPTATISPTTAVVQVSTSTFPTPEPSLTPADTLTPTPLLTEIIDDQGISMRFVPAGEFIMGSDNGQNDEKPPHSVVLGGYYMDVYEVTNRSYKNCVDADVCTSPSNTKSKTRDFYYGDPAYDDYPVIYVDWNQAKTYCAWRGARLPSEAEWEKAARGADGWAYPWGDVFDGTRINFCDKNCSLDWAETFYDDGYADTAPIGSYEMGKSIYDLYDMSGNAAEWTADMYSAYPGGTLDVNDNTAQSYRVFRGGAWYYIVDNLRISNRGWSTPDSIDSGIGFRCARDAQP